MEQQSDRCSGQHGSMPTTDSGSNHKHNHGSKGVREGASVLDSQESEVERYVIQVDSDGRNESRDVEATGCVDEAR